MGGLLPNESAIRLTDAPDRRATELIRPQAALSGSEGCGLRLVSVRSADLVALALACQQDTISRSNRLLKNSKTAPAGIVFPIGNHCLAIDPRSQAKCARLIFERRPQDAFFSNPLSDLCSTRTPFSRLCVDEYSGARYCTIALGGRGVTVLLP